MTPCATCGSAGHTTAYHAEAAKLQGGKIRKYEIKDAVMLKECMKQIAEIKAKYPNLWQFDQSWMEELKEAIEFIQEMVEKEV